MWLGVFDDEEFALRRRTKSSSAVARFVSSSESKFKIMFLMLVWVFMLVLGDVVELYMFYVLL